VRFWLVLQQGDGVFRMLKIRNQVGRGAASEEAEAAHTIFSRYLELGSIGALIAKLDRRGIRT
jgi:hypothetical protein